MFEQYSGAGLEIKVIYIIFSIDKDDVHVKLYRVIWNINGFESRPDIFLFVSGKKNFENNRLEIYHVHLS
jgi:hypothetical protein